MKLSFVSPILLSALLLSSVCFGQEPPAPKQGEVKPKETVTPKEPVVTAAAKCDVPGDLASARQLATEAKSLVKAPADILIMTRAAEQIWPWYENEARDLLTEAYDLTEKYFRDPFETLGQRKKIWGQLENPHFVVIGAIARRDPEWAKQLAERVRTEAERFSIASNNFDPAGRRLGAALALLPSNLSLSVSLAQSSLRYPASRSLLSYLFMLAAIDQQLADKFFLEALQANQYGSVEALMNLAPYSFRLNRVVCEGDY